MNHGTLTQRIEDLERQSRRLKAITVAIAAALLLPWILGAGIDTRNQTIHGRRFVLTDGKGKLRVFLGADEDDEGRVGLYLYDQLGKRSAALYVKKGHSGLALYGDGNQERARLELGEQDVSLTLYDGNAQNGAVFSQGQTLSQLVLGAQAKLQEEVEHRGDRVDRHAKISLSSDSRRDGLSLISMGDVQTGSHIQLKTNPQGSHLLLRNQDHHARVEVAPATDRPSIKLNTSEPSPSIAIVDADGQVVASLP